MKKIILATVLAGIGSTGALAADLGARTYTKAPAMMAPVATWTGLYIGGNVGYGSGSNSTDANFVPQAAFFPLPQILGVKSKGVVRSAQIGYNFQLGGTVFGLETDVQGSGISGSASVAPLTNPVLGTLIPGSSITTDQKISWFGTTRARLGFSVTPDLLLYGTAGAGYGGVKATGDTFHNAVYHRLGTLDQTKLGWTAGAGAEWMFARNWSAKVEYLYLDLGSSTVLGPCNCGGPAGTGV